MDVTRGPPFSVLIGLGKSIGSFCVIFKGLDGLTFSLASAARRFVDSDLTRSAFFDILLETRSDGVLDIFFPDSWPCSSLPGLPSEVRRLCFVVSIGGVPCDGFFVIVSVDLIILDETVCLGAWVDMYRDATNRAFGFSIFGIET